MSHQANLEAFIAAYRVDSKLQESYEIKQMLHRLQAGKTAILPFLQGSLHHWLVLQAEERSLLKHTEELKHFLVPVYAESAVRKREPFSPNNTLGRAGAICFAAGYLSFCTPTSQLKSVWHMVNLWCHMDDNRPEISLQEPEESLFFLRNQFQQAVAIQNWDLANQTLHLLRVKKYLSDENLLFLQVQVLAGQGLWRTIWEMEEYPYLSGLEIIPTRVKTALLTAFYHANLAQTDSEGDTERSRSSFSDHQSRLGTLLRSQIGISEEVVLRVFSYHAAQEGSLGKLERYRTQTSDDTTRLIIDNLIRSLAPKATEDSTWEQAQRHFKMQEYEDAYLLLLDLELTVKKANLLCLLALMTEADEICQEAYAAYQSLQETEQRDLLAIPTSKGAIRFVLEWRNGGEKLVASDNAVDTSLPRTWAQWWGSLLRHEHSTDELRESLEQLGEQLSLPTTFAHLKELAEQLLDVTLTSFDRERRTLMQTAIPMLASVLLQAQRYPDPMAREVYEYTRTAIVHQGNWNETHTGLLLRLTEGLLAMDLTARDVLWTDVETWFTKFPMESLVHYALEALELFKETGLDVEKLRGVWTQWVASLTERMISHSRSTLDSWLQLGELCHGDFELLQLLTEMRDVQISDDPIAALHPMRITIFSLREKAAVRAAQRIRERNSSLQIQVCTEDRMSDQAKSSVQNADLVIVVTTCMSHALTYGISPYLQNAPLYPRSSGETGILDIVEAYARERHFQIV